MLLCLWAIGKLCSSAFCNPENLLCSSGYEIGPSVPQSLVGENVFTVNDIQIFPDVKKKKVP